MTPVVLPRIIDFRKKPLFFHNDFFFRREEFLLFFLLPKIKIKMDFPYPLGKELMRGENAIIHWYRRPSGPATGNGAPLFCLRY